MKKFFKDNGVIVALITLAIGLIGGMITAGMVYGQDKGEIKAKLETQAIILEQERNDRKVAQKELEEKVETNKDTINQVVVDFTEIVGQLKVVLGKLETKLDSMEN
jgi:Na+-translocating ferredoxin:NAD+ oxidoreductase RnfG subunit